MIKLKKIFYRNSVRFLLSSLAVSVAITAMGLLLLPVVSAPVTDGDGLPALSEGADRYTFVLDPGHGGEDGGAVGADGTEEKHLNLEIGKCLYDLMLLNGQSVLLTRTEDTLLYDYYHDLEDYTGHKKMYDLRNRLKITEQTDDAVYVGIHMNKFTDPRYGGLQVYYSPKTPKSNVLAGMIQMSVKNACQPDNNRAVKAATSGIYVLNECHTPAVLVECGFLSNPEECHLLNTESYRCKLATAIFHALCTFENTKNDPTDK